MLAPTAITRSASWKYSIAVFEAYRPEMPAWYSLSAIQFFARKLVATSAPVRLASDCIASPAPDQIAPRPATITGFFAFAIASAACCSACSSGRTRRGDGKSVDDGTYA